MQKRVAILGGGVAGMSAAHELIKRRFNVSVYEASGVVGGKARSLGKPGSGTGGRPDLPAEHGFHFFPGFYKHLPATMQEIQVGLVRACDHLEQTTGTQLARTGGAAAIIAPTQFPTSFQDLIQAFHDFTLFYCDMGIPKSEVADFVRCLVIMLVSSDLRRFNDYEKESWFDFLGAATKSDAFRRYLAKGLSRSLVALNAKDLSARTGACILLRFLMVFTEYRPLDRVLDLPTSDAWLEPWLAQLQRDGVDFHFNASVQSIDCSGGRISGIRVQRNGIVQQVTADYYVAALPVEVMQAHLTPEILAADPSLSSILDLRTSWMTGIIYYLNTDVPLVNGHSNYLDSPWALTSISQAQFWKTIDLSHYGAGNVRGVLSVIISDWDKPLVGNGPSAKECSEDEVKAIVWQQLKDHLNSAGSVVLDDHNRVDCFLSPCLVYNPAGNPKWTDNEQLFINTKDSWTKRPNAATAIDNFYLASDYVRTYTDLATMESQRGGPVAVNAILDNEGSAQPRCESGPPTNRPFWSAAE